jgi:ribosomal protein L34E
VGMTTVCSDCIAPLGAAPGHRQRRSPRRFSPARVPSRPFTKLCPRLMRRSNLFADRLVKSVPGSD